MRYDDNWPLVELGCEPGREDGQGHLHTATSDGGQALAPAPLAPASSAAQGQGTAAQDEDQGQVSQEATADSPNPEAAPGAPGWSAAQPDSTAVTTTAGENGRAGKAHHGATWKAHHGATSKLRGAAERALNGSEDYTGAGAGPDLEPGTRGPEPETGESPGKGPSVPGGRAQNALRHGGYARKTSYISRGPLKEDGDAVRQFEEAIVAGLDAQNVLAEEGAWAVARTLTNQRRFQDYQAHVISLRSAYPVIEQEMLPYPGFGPSAFIGDVLFVLDQLVSRSAFLVGLELPKLAPELPHIRWRDLGFYVVSCLEPGHELLEEEAPEPTDKQWPAIVEQLLRSHFATPGGARAWVDQLLESSGAGLMAQVGYDVAAAAAIKALDELVRTEARITDQVARSYRNFLMLNGTLPPIVPKKQKGPVGGIN